MVDSLSRLRRPHIEDGLKNEDDLKKEDDLKNENDPKNEDDPKNQDNPKNEVRFLCMALQKHVQPKNGTHAASYDRVVQFFLHVWF